MIWKCSYISNEENMIVLFANILTFSTGSAGFRTNSSDNLLNRNSSFGRPSFFSSWQTRLIEIQDSPLSIKAKEEKRVDLKTVKPCPAPAYPLGSIF